MWRLKIRIYRFINLATGCLEQLKKSSVPKRTEDFYFSLNN